MLKTYTEKEFFLLFIFNLLQINKINFKCIVQQLSEKEFLNEWDKKEIWIDNQIVSSY